MERFRDSQDKMPESLDELSGDYIDSIPLDPFTGKELLYHTDKQSYTIYSVGPDRLDDGGAIKRKTKKEQALDLGVKINLY